MNPITTRLATLILFLLLSSPSSTVSLPSDQDDNGETKERISKLVDDIPIHEGDIRHDGCNANSATDDTDRLSSAPPKDDDNNNVIHIDERPTTPLHTPPTHFHITSHVQTNLATGLSYFLPPSESFAHLPFLECGAVGSTTESVPLVSGVFRHVPNCCGLRRSEARRDVKSVVLEDARDASAGEDGVVDGELVMTLDGEGLGESVPEVEDSDDGQSSEHQPKRPSPPRYIVALSPFEITVGGNGNQTQVFQAGDVVFMEDSWWGVWNEDGSDGDDAKVEENNRMKGYIMRAHPDSKQDLNVLMLTVPPAVHRHWKNAQQHKLTTEKERDASNAPKSFARKASHRKPRWKLNLNRHNPLPKPCSLESDPSFSHPAASSTTLGQHFTQHFVKLMRGHVGHPHVNFLPSQELVLPVLAQAVAGMVGGMTALGLVVQLWRMVNVQAAVGFGGACVVGLGTWGFVWLGEVS
ncbi:hypothetical protein HJC23_005962 [Cyclotella cryptica]|uniref:SH3 domain-containing protein n=1 Tax=Cyclotella cryptica TaxID=29204 RepID=A0ABD3QZT0_9STRA